MSGLISLIGKFVSTISASPAAAAAPTFTFTVPAGCIFKGMVSVYSQAGGDGNVGCFQITNTTLGAYAAHISPEADSNTGESYGKTEYLELPAGDYTTAWAKTAGGSNNVVSILGNCYKVF
jgi:hypothetical protein